MTTSIPHNLAREGTSDQYAPRKEDKFTFGLWTVGNRGRDPFRDFVRPPLDPVHIVKKLEATFDIQTLANRGLHYEKLDQLTVEIILGTR